AVVALAATAYLGVGYVIYSQLSPVTPRCPTHAENTPAQFIVHSDKWRAFDTTPYSMSHYEEIKIASRQPGLMLSAWYVEADPTAPTVILTHGLGSCKHDHTILVPAGMLYRAGFNVLMFDMRDHGFSDIEDGRTAIGNEEYLDLLGAWDWLQTEKGIAPERIGLYGTSLGAATTLAAFAEEPRTAAAFVDSPFADLNVVIAEELQRNRYPTFLAPAGLLMARLVAGDDLLAHPPLDAVRRAAGRPLFVVHGDADARINQHHTRDLAALGAQTAANIKTWLPIGIGHVEAVLASPEEYEQRLLQFFREALAE
ncbi:MAG: alpha/beta hydrolase, partial [Anaerolineales bacterium]